MFTESSSASPQPQQAAYDSEFHQLEQTQHQLWYSSWHWSRHPNTECKQRHTKTTKHAVSWNI